MSEGPTTAGSIVGKLKLDKAQWDADVAAAKADARELGATSPTIRVDANVGDAVAKLEAVRVAEAGVSDGNNNMGQSAGGAASRFALIAGAVAALIPMTTALAGYAVGVSGALAGMGAAGVLAIFGIRNAMQDGTAAGNTFSAGLQVAEGYLHQLEQTASNGILTGFGASLSIIGAAMPQLNQQIAMFSKQLGATASFITQGVVTALNVLNPLFVQAGQYIEQVAHGLDAWTSNGGLQQFTTMAMGALPQVATALESLVKGALDLIGAFAPFGGVMLNVLTLVGGLVSAIAPLLANLTPLAAVAATVYGGFRLWDNIAPTVKNAASAIRGFGLDLSVMGGLAGIAVGVLGYIASSFVTARLASSAAANALEDYTAAVAQDNGVIGTSVKQQTAKALADKNSLGNYNSLGISAIAIGQRLGLSAKTTADAAMGQHSAILKVNQAMTDYANNPANSTAKVAAFRANWINLTGVISDNNKKVQDALKAYNDIAQAQGLTTLSTTAQLKAQSDLAAQYGMSLPAFLSAQVAQKQNADQADATTQALQLENDAASLLTNAFNTLNGTNLSVAQAQTSAAAATNTFTDSLKQNGDGIDGNSKAAVANQQALQGKAAADQAAAEAIAKQTGSTQAGTAAFAASKQALIEQLKAAGNLTPAIQALIDKYYAVPPVVKTKAEMDADAALQTVANLKAEMASIHDQTVTLTVVTNSVGAPAALPANATGGAYKYADGGTVHAVGGLTVPGDGSAHFDSVRAMLAPSEEVISNKYGQASANRNLLKAVNAGASPSQIAALAARQAGGQSSQAAPVYVTVTSNGVDLSKYIDVRVEQGGKQLASQINRELNGGLV